MSRIEPEYGTTADGLMAARLDYMAYIAIPESQGFRIASGYQLRPPIAEWTAKDVYGYDRKVAGEVEFRAYVEAVAHHFRQRAALGRKVVEMRISTPWGMSQDATIYAEGIVCHSTASHGGFKLDRARNAAMPPALRVMGGWYEEDAEWAKVALGYPDLFTDREKASADRTLRDWYPDAWEAVHGRALSPQESFQRDRERFEREHAKDWVVIAAIGSKRFPGQVETFATLGGRRLPETPERQFLVPDDEYTVDRHQEMIAA